MSATRQRVFHDDNGTFKDVSTLVNDPYKREADLSIVAAEDKIYIGSELPFNHRYFLLGDDVNAAAALISKVEIWGGSDWHDAVDLIDETENAAGSATLAQSGHVSFTVDRNESWIREEDTEHIDDFPASVTVYNLYWIRITFTSDLTANLKIKHIGHRFADDEDLKAQYPDLLEADVLDSWEAGKTDWDVQHLVAAQRIIDRLIAKKVCENRNQILERWDWNEAAIHKVAEIIYSQFGEDFEERRKRAAVKYRDALNDAIGGIPKIDRDMDGREDTYERVRQVGLIRR